MMSVFLVHIALYCVRVGEGIVIKDGLAKWWTSTRLGMFLNVGEVAE
jgi:hypothetical protein